MQRSGGARPDEVPEQPPMVTFPAGTHDGHVAPVVGPRSARRHERGGAARRAVIVANYL